jgi:predicted transcriptional regulator of viral defense system
MDGILSRREVNTVWLVDVTPTQLREIANHLEQASRMEAVSPGQDVLTQLTHRISLRYAVPPRSLVSVERRRAHEEIVITQPAH